MVAFCVAGRRALCPGDCLESFVLETCIGRTGECDIRLLSRRTFGCDSLASADVGCLGDLHDDVMGYELLVQDQLECVSIVGA